MSDQLSRNRSKKFLSPLLPIASLLISSALLNACKSAVGSTPVGTPVAIRAPLGLPPVPIPQDNQPTASEIALGRKLFYDPSLSKDNSLACASCHVKMFRFSDARPRSIGVVGKLGLRHAPTLVNVAYSSAFFWDGRAANLETQVLSPIADPLEMNQSHDASVGKLRDNPAYRQMFFDAFGTDDITIERVQKALASFERERFSAATPLSTAISI